MQQKITFISTVFNEEKNIEEFINSVLIQTKKPEQIIIVDGGSTDRTLEIIRKKRVENPKIEVIEKKGNRSVGRNEAVKKSKHEIIACSDAGCILDTRWLEKIIEPFNNSKTEVVAGYYAGNAETIFQKSLVPYVLVMPDRLNTNDFLPATRSIAFKRSVWRKAGGFPENLSHNEDYAFARKLREIKAKIVFKKDAIVYWRPRKKMLDSFKMFFRFAYGDAEARIFRPKVAAIFIRYILAVIILFAAIIDNFFFLYLLLTLFIFYIFWSISKNYRYVKEKGGLIYLPLIQLISDIAVISGTLLGFLGLLKPPRTWEEEK